MARTIVQRGNEDIVTETVSQVNSSTKIEIDEDDTPNNSGESISEAAEKAGENLLKFVEEQIEKMNNKLLFSGKREPSLYELDIALSTYEQTYLGIVALYEQAKFDESLAKEKFNEWYATKYMEIRNRYNTKDVKNASWLSAKEIDATVYTMYKGEAATLKANIIEAEGKRSLMERLTKGWSDYLFVLRQLSSNSIGEMKASNATVDLKRGDEVESYM